MSFFMRAAAAPRFHMTQAVLCGDSLTLGTGASVPANRWSTLLCNAFGAAENNLGVGGQCITPGTGNVFDFSVIPVYPGFGAKLFGSWGANDFVLAVTAAGGNVQTGLANYKSALKTRFIDQAVIKGWPKSEIHMIADWYFNGNPSGSKSSIDRFYLFFGGLIEVALTEGVQLISNLGVYGFADAVDPKIHPNDAGHLSIANKCIAQLNARSLTPELDGFMTAIGSSDPVYRSAFNTFINTYKSNGLWTKAKYIYLNAGGTLASTDINMKYPSLFRKTRVGGMTVSPNGILYDGATGYGRTGCIPSEAVTGGSGIRIYCRNNAVTGAGQVDAGTYDGTRAEYISAKDGAGNFSGKNSNAGITIQVANADSRGDYAIENPAGTARIYKTGAEVGQAVVSNSPTQTQEMYEGAWNNNGAAALFSNREIELHEFGDALTTAEELIRTNAYATLRAAIGR